MIKDIARTIKIMLTAVMVFTAFISPVNTAWAAEGEKTAILNNMLVSFDGKEPVTVQAYNIDGFNYVRARDITNGINIKVEAIDWGDTGIHILPFYPAENISPLEALTEKTINVKLADSYIFYEGELFPVQCFSHNERYFFKVADIVSVSEKRLDAYVKLTKGYATGGYATAPPMDNFISLSAEWNAETGIMAVNKVTTDLWEVFKGEEKAVTVNTQKAPENNQNTAVNNIPVSESVKPVKAVETLTESESDTQPTGQQPLTEPPKKGVQLADILIDESAGAYLDNGDINIDNISTNYKTYTGNFGQCTWYAKGRFIETTGINVEDNPVWNGTTITDWLSNAENNDYPHVKAVRNNGDIKAQNIAVWKGHVAFIEYVEYDNSGNPDTVYFSEANTNSDGIYHAGKDAVIQVKSFSDFVKSNGGLIGYIAAK